ncbi:MAG: peroxiredoxin [Ignavibacteriaceae bacterium]|nr:peroxiredoxin [Ignavibacteriaceae bacterium]
MIGNFVENFILKDQDGKDFDLYENLDKNILLLFYPKDNSPVCTRQLSNYQTNLAEFEKVNIRVVGINSNDRESHQSFCKNIGLEITMLTDENKTVSKKFNAVNFVGFIKRKLVLVSSSKKILYEKTTLSLNFIDSNAFISELKSLKII